MKLLEAVFIRLAPESTTSEFSAGPERGSRLSGAAHARFTPGGGAPLAALPRELPGRRPRQRGPTAPRAPPPSPPAAPAAPALPRGHSRGRGPSPGAGATHSRGAPLLSRRPAARAALGSSASHRGSVMSTIGTGSTAPPAAARHSAAGGPGRAAPPRPEAEPPPSLGAGRSRSRSWSRSRHKPVEPARPGPAPPSL